MRKLTCVSPQKIKNKVLYVISWKLKWFFHRVIGIMQLCIPITWIPNHLCWDEESWVYLWFMAALCRSAVWKQYSPIHGLYVLLPFVILSRSPLWSIRWRLFGLAWPRSSSLVYFSMLINSDIPKMTHTVRGCWSSLSLGRPSLSDATTSCLLQSSISLKASQNLISLDFCVFLPHSHLINEGEFFCSINAKS